MKTLKQITTRNLQSHKEVVIDLPRTGLIRFSGPNSNGKSVIDKVLKALVSGHITSPKVRNTLINKDSVSGEIELLSYDDDRLVCHLQREASATYVMLHMHDGEPITRYLSDKTWIDLVYTFGFCYNKERDIPLQIVDDESPLLFLATSNKVNSEVINTALSDESASLALDQFDILIKDVNNTHIQTLGQINLYKQTMSTLKTYDTEMLMQMKEKLEKHYDIIHNLYFPNLPSLPDMTPVHFLDLYFPEVPELPDMTPVHILDLYFPELPELPDMTPVFYLDIYFPNNLEIEWPELLYFDVNIIDVIPLIEELKELKANKCPTCGRPWVD